MARPTKPVTVYHPTLDGVSETVPAGDASGWTDAGWRKTAPKTDPAEEPLRDSGTVAAPTSVEDPDDLIAKA